MRWLRMRRKQSTQKPSAEILTETQPAAQASPAPQAAIAFSGAPSAADAEYLDDIRMFGGDYVRHYKMYSYTLLDLGADLTVLDVGCGDGEDLRALSAAVGPTGSVIGLDYSADLLARAEEKLQADGGVPRNVRFLQGDAHRIPLPDASVDRARTDRAMQHFSDPAASLREIWRVLRPGGAVTLIEPDWGMMVLYPGSVAGGDDDRALGRAMQAVRSTIAHPLMGRQLYSLLRGLGENAWEKGTVQIQAITYTLTNWKTVNSFLSLSDVVELLGKDDQETYEALSGWLEALQDAGRQGTFLAALPIFLATAWKANS